MTLEQKIDILNNYESLWIVYKFFGRHICGYDITNDEIEDRMQHFETQINIDRQANKTTLDQNSIIETYSKLKIFLLFKQYMQHNKYFNATDFSIYILGVWDESKYKHHFDKFISQNNVVMCYN